MRDRRHIARAPALAAGLLALTGLSGALAAPLISSSPAWTLEVDQANAFFGWSVGTAGDVNGDGFEDLIVGASGPSAKLPAHHQQPAG